MYSPKPIDTSHIKFSPEIEQLLERLAANTHEVWAAQRIKDGWTYGPLRNDASKQHPGLVPYEQLPESEKDYDRQTAGETLKALLAMGYRIEN